MQNMENKERMIDELALNLLKQARSVVLLNMGFTIKAIGALDIFKTDISLGSDGRFLYYEPKHILRLYKKGDKELIHSYMHTLFHCIFRHWSFGSGLNLRLWSIACDIACESLLFDMEFAFTKDDMLKERLSIIGELENKISLLTAEKIYSYLKNENISEVHLKRYEEAFRFDDHSMWKKKGKYEDEEKQDTLHIPSKEGKKNYDDRGKVEQGQTGENKEGKTPKEEKNPKEEKGDKGEREEKSAEDVLNFLSDEEKENFWREIAKNIKKELDISGKGNSKLSLVRKFESITEPKYDYAAFLEKFAVSKENMGIDPDTMDYGFYRYGMELYGNVALVEPLEYKQVKKIKDFVIAIDTSGSVSTKMIERFLTKTYGILKNKTSFFAKTNIYILQCDNRIRDMEIIEDVKDIDTYIKNMSVKGLGGTDFRPVFEYVDENVKQGIFNDLKGLIYFTDGLGVFPEKKPCYESVFIFLKENYRAFVKENNKLPSWAMKLVLDEEDI